MKYISVLIIIFIMLIQGFSQENTLIIKPSKEGNMLRWFPADFDTWFAGMQNGFYIERAEEGGIFKRLHTSPILAKGDEDTPSSKIWKQIFSYRDSIDVLKNHPHGDRLAKGIYREYRRAIAIEEDGIANSGLYFIDTSADANKVYVYRFHLAGGAPLAEAKTNAPKNYPLPELMIEDEEERFSIKWHQDRSWHNFQSFSLERSQNSRDFTTVNKAWMYPIAYPESYKISIDSFQIADSVVLNKSYFYRLVGINAFGEQMVGKTMKVISKDQTPPKAPIGFDTESIPTDKLVNLHWKKPEKEADFIGFNIYRSLFYDSAFVKINAGLLSISTNTFTDKILTSEGKYYYQISAIDKNGNEGYSFTKSAVFPDKTPPATPIGIDVSIENNGHVQIHWQSNKEADLAGYVLASARYKNAEFVTLTQNAIQQTNFKDTLALNFINRNYYYKIASQDLMGNLSNFSEPVMVLLPDTIAPIVPILSPLERKGEELVIYWQIAKDADLAYCELFKKQPLDKEWSSIFKSKDPKGNTSSQPYLETGEWQYMVQAVDSTGNRSPLSNIRYVEFKKNTALAAANKLSYTLSGKSNIQLNWEYPLVKDQLFFLVLRRTNDESEPKLLAKVSSRSFVDKGVEKGQNYEYFIMAQSSDGRYALPSDSVQVAF